MKFNVYEFNQKRNGFALDEKLEIDMLNEECREFFAATTFSERISEYIDFKYVALGTEMKVLRNGESLTAEKRRWIESTSSMMFDIISEEGESLGITWEDMGEILEKAKSIICELNGGKPLTKNEHGKVQKTASSPKSSELINNMIAEGYLK